jgi:hypothetical protein
MVADGLRSSKLAHLNNKSADQSEMHRGFHQAVFHKAGLVGQGEETMVIGFQAVEKQRFQENGAVKKTRTSTGFRPQRPQRCASTNSAMTALALTGRSAPLAKGRCRRNRYIHDNFRLFMCHNSGRKCIRLHISGLLVP